MQPVQCEVQTGYAKVIMSGRLNLQVFVTRITTLEPPVDIKISQFDLRFGN
jgi:hypothetical protein